MDADPHSSVDGRADSSEHWRLAPAVLFLALVAGVFLHESLIGGKLLTQIDALALFEPWASEAPEDFRASNELLLDQSLQMLPYLAFFQERIAEGELPLWNPHNYAGHPIAAVPTGALFWPLHWFYFAFPSWNYHAWSAWLRITLTGLFMLLFLRELGTTRIPATLGATAFALCGFSVVWLNHPHTQVSMFLPLLFYFAERMASRPNLRTAGAMAPVFALVFLGGHLQTAAHVLIGFGLYVAFRWLVARGSTRPSGRALVQMAAAGLLGLLIAMPLLLPFFEYMRVSHGALISSERDLVGSVEPLEALRFLFAPDHAGHPQAGDYTGPIGSHLNYQELVGGYVGRFVLLLSAVGLVLGRRDRRTWFFAGLGLFALAVACQAPPFYEAMRAVPLVKSSKLFRFFLLVAFCLSALGAIGLDRLLRQLSLSRAASTLVGGVACVLVAVELGVWGFGYNPAIERDAPTFLPETEVTDFLQGEPGHFRVLGQDASILIPNANLFYGIDLITGYDAMEYQTMTELIGLLTTRKEREYSIKEIPWFDKPLPLWNLLNVKYVLATVPLPAPLVPVLEGPVRIYENPLVQARAFVASRVELIEDKQQRLARLGAPDFDPRVAIIESPLGVELGTEPVRGEVRIESYEPRRVMLSADLESPGMVVLADAWDPGWIALVNGEAAPIHRVDHSLRGIWVGAGSSSIELHHDPASFRLGVWLAAFGLIVSLLLLLRASPTNRSPDRANASAAR